MDASPQAKARWLFTAVLLLGAGALAAWLLPSTWRSTTYELRSRETVSGLLPGAPVEFHGVEVGQVRKVELVEPRLVRVLLEVDRAAPVSSATVATITGRGLATRGFTGYVYVNLEDAGDAGRPLAQAPGSAYLQLPLAPARQVSLDTTMQELNQSVQAVNGLLQATLDPRTVASLKSALAGLEQVTQTLAANNEKLGRTIANAERASGQLQPLLANSEAALRTVQTQLLPRADATLARVDGTLANAEQASARLVPLLQASNDTVLTLQTQVLPQAQRTLVHVDQLSTAMGDAAQRIRRDPSLLLRGGHAAVPGPGEVQ